jgi:hypothetical protein
VGTQFKYAYPGPPFNWLGTLTRSQLTAFEQWVSDRETNFPPIQTWYQIRAQQFRKASGLLEQYYATLYDEPLAPTFQKTAWLPGPQGHWVPNPRNDHIPMVTISSIKAAMQPQFERDDEAVFHMNHLRTIIERNEDEAQYASEAPVEVQAAIKAVESLFSQPQYQAVLVDDMNAGNMYNGTTPYWRANALDAPTQWELEQASRTTPGGPIQVKYVDTEPGQ